MEITKVDRIAELVEMEVRRQWPKRVENPKTELRTVHFEVYSAPKEYQSDILTLWTHYTTRGVDPQGSGAHLMVPYGLVKQDEWVAKLLATRAIDDVLRHEH